MRQYLFILSAFFLIPLSQGNNPTTSKSGNIQVFDDGVFNLEPKEQPATVTSPEGKVRPRGERANYNREQRERVIQSCGSSKNSDNAGAFSECVKDGLAKEEKQVQDKLSRDRDGLRSLPGMNEKP